MLANEGRARLMSVAMRLQTAALLPDDRHKLETLRHAIRMEKQVSDTLHGEARAASLSTLARMRGEVLTLVKTAGPGAPGAVEEARAIAAKGGAVVVPVVTRYGGKLEDYAFFNFATRYHYAFLGVRRADGELVGMLRTQGEL